MYDKVILDKFRRFYDDATADGISEKDIPMRFQEKENIRRLRYAPKNQTPVTIPSAFYKAYVPADYLYADVWAIPPGKKGGKTRYEGQFVSRWEAVRLAAGRMQESGKPHPAAKRVMRVFKGDLLELSMENSERHIAIAKGFSTTENKLDVYSIFSSGALEDWLTNTSEPMLDPYWPKKKGHNFVSINVIFSQFTVKKINLDVDGQPKMPIRRR